MYKIRLLSPFRREYQTEYCFFSKEIHFQEADALLCEWAPDKELLTFEGPKGWYNSEAVSRNLFNSNEWEQAKKDWLINHMHPNPAHRVPMICFVDPLINLNTNDRLDRAIAIISNSGYAWPKTFEMLHRRNQFALHSQVDLYGKEENWRLFMQKHQMTLELPANYEGEIKGTWNSELKYSTMAAYKAAICMENVTEPYYFTEKFHAAAQAGCIPIYHAHPTVKAGILIGAMWVDPANFDFDPDATLRFALAQDRQEYAQCNFAWLQTEHARSAGLIQVFSRLGTILTQTL